MADYSPPTENLPIFDSSVFTTDDKPLTYNDAKKKFLRYPNAQGKENLQEIEVNGASQFNQKALMTSNINDEILEINRTNGYTNTGLNLINSGINQSQSSILDFVNQLGQLNLITGKDININAGKIYMYEQNGTGNYLSQYVNSTDYKWDTNIGGSLYNVLSLNVNNGLSIEAKTTFTNTLKSTTIQPSFDDNSNLIPTTSWVQGAINNGSNPNPQFNSITIGPIATVFNSSLSFINNIYNLGGTYGLSGNTTQSYGSGWSPSSIPSIQFRTDNHENTFNMNNSVLFRLDMFYWSGSNYGETSCKILIFPSAIKSNWGINPGTTTIYNINNKIDGNSSFNYTDSIYAPFGRQYWTFDQSFSGVSNANAYLQGYNISSGIFQISIWPQLFDNITNWSWNITCLNSNSAQNSPAEPMGIVLTFS